MTTKPHLHDYVSADLRSTAELRARIERLEAENVHLRRLLRFKARQSMGSSDPATPIIH